jgi:hypothetical protein
MLDPLPGTRAHCRAGLVGGSCGAHTLAPVSIGAAIAVGAVVGLALGIVVSVTTEVPLAPEAGLVLGGVEVHVFAVGVVRVQRASHGV